MDNLKAEETRSVKLGEGTFHAATLIFFRPTKLRKALMFS
ncbi:MAG: hypothetical protein QOJ64_2494, partial [Acidobacteriota bacterium]|nr:hypothetical protein [Acidobacteriota bacterium]